MSKNGASCEIGEINPFQPSMIVNVPALSKALRNHPNRCFVNYLITGLVQGFLGGLCWLPKTTHVCKNYQSALKEPEVVDKLLEKGFMIGPFSKSPFSLFRVRPIGVATCKYSGKKRLIIDLSAPHNGPVPCVTSLIPLTPFSLFYAMVDNAIQIIKSTGQGAWLRKADITDAFKVMPLHPSQWHLFGVKLYFAVKLTFGCQSSPRIYDTPSEALCWVFYNTHKLPFVLHLLDDFLGVDFPASPPAQCISIVRDVFSSLGVPLSEEKTVGPGTHIEFLGIMLDGAPMQASLPGEKLWRIRNILKSFSSATSVLKKGSSLCLAT